MTIHSKFAAALIAALNGQYRIIDSRQEGTKFLVTIGNDARVITCSFVMTEAEASALTADAFDLAIWADGAAREIKRVFA